MLNNTQIDATEIINVMAQRLAEKEKEIAILTVQNNSLTRQLQNPEEKATK